MKNLNNYINEAWSGVKQQSLKQDIEAWCGKMGIRNYTINSQGEIDVNGNVMLYKKDLKELPYKFGRVNGLFDIDDNKNLISLKNCPDYVGLFFRCDNCPQLDSLEGCPKKVMGSFYCRGCKKQFTKEDITKVYKCKVRGTIEFK